LEHWPERPAELLATLPKPDDLGVAQDPLALYLRARGQHAFGRADLDQILRPAPIKEAAQRCKNAVCLRPVPFAGFLVEQSVDIGSHDPADRAVPPASGLGFEDSPNLAAPRSSMVRGRIRSQITGSGVAKAHLRRSGSRFLGTTLRD